MQSMVEKVARALSVADGFHPEATSNDGEEQPAWTLYVAMAKAAIEAMRTPTEPMISEMESAATFGIGRPNDDEAIPRLWNWAIDAALKEPA